VSEKKNIPVEDDTRLPTPRLQSARLADTAKRLESCRRAVIEQDFKMLAEVVEQDSNLMHAVMMTSQPPLIYWLPETLAVILAVKAMRNKDIRACYTIDAGPNVHVLCPEEDSQGVYKRMVDIRGVKGNDLPSRSDRQLSNNILNHKSDINTIILYNSLRVLLELPRMIEYNWISKKSEI
jgi:mevalonate pyrophosphate decarboxylase